MITPVAFDGSGDPAPRICRMIDELGIPLSNGSPVGNRWLLTTIDGVLSLTEPDQPGHKPLSVDLVRSRRKHGSLPIPKRGPMAQALGRATRTVVDATAGWGNDMFLMWLMGYDVVAVERSVVVGALLLDGLARLEQYDPVADYPRVEIAESMEFLERHSADCVYLDPMFPPRRKTSPLVKRPLRVLRELVGNDDDRTALFEAARRAATKRVVVKRPNQAGAWHKPDQSFVGKIMTYDLYLKRA